MNDSHKTTAIRRPTVKPSTATGSGRSGRRTGTSPPPPKGRSASSVSTPGDTRFSDFTRPIPVDRQLVRGRKRGLIWVGGLVIGAALMAAFFVFPIQAWMRQQDDIERRQQKLDVLVDANAQLSSEINRLRTPEGIKEAARTEIGYVESGEIRVAIQDQPNAPLTLPGGFPYDAIAQTIVVRASTPLVP